MLAHTQFAYTSFYTIYSVGDCHVWLREHRNGMTISYFGWLLRLEGPSEGSCKKLDVSGWEFKANIAVLHNMRSWKQVCSLDGTMSCLDRITGKSKLVYKHCCQMLARCKSILWLPARVSQYPSAVHVHKHSYLYVHFVNSFGVIAPSFFTSKLSNTIPQQQWQPKLGV